MTTEQNKTSHRRFIEEAWNKGNPAVFEELNSPNVVAHFLPPGLPRNLEGLKMFVQSFRTAFPDVHITIDDQLADGDKTVARWTMTGTQTGPFLGMPPTGRKINASGIEICRYDADGKRIEGWSSFDRMTMMQQLGAIPAPQAN
jgi:steroid delta-isomerase-like uncharacterized protein